MIQELKTFASNLFDHQGAADPESELPAALLTEAQNHLGRLVGNIDQRGYECDLTGTGIAPWIQPLHFDENLEAALNSLEIVDGLLMEYRQLVVSEIQQNYVASELANSEFEDRHKELERLIDFDALRESFRFRITKKALDLIEYSKAAKYGAVRLFSIHVDEVPAAASQDGLHRIREPLRQLVEKHRIMKMGEQHKIIPISLKHAKYKSGKKVNEHIVANWQQGIAEHTHGYSRRLSYDQLSIDLSHSGFPDSHRVLRMGVSILDWHSQQLPSQNRPLIGAQKTWGLEVRDNSDGFASTREEGASRLPISPTVFSNVPGQRNVEPITWAQNESLQNVNANRSWLVQVDNKSYDNSSRFNIYDIVLYFHIAYMSEFDV